ncbi:hypothetical protein K501DRAFT_308506 [Backusella circina FSU 941]|nr:hypothetical protein K501DRAFT_308506 [Backusella circina FSU 941]
MSLQTENQSFKLEKATFGHQIMEKDDKISALENENRTYRTSSIQRTQQLETLHHEKATLEQLLKLKEDTIVLLNRENNLLSTANQGNQQGTNEMTETLKSLLQAKTNETELLKQNMELVSANEKRRIDALEREIRMLKQKRARQQTTVQSTVTFNNNISPSHIGSGQHDHYDDPNNDINYDTEISNDEESEDDDDINYDTPSEDGNN